MSAAQIEVLRLHVGTTRAKVRRNPYDGNYFRQFSFPTHPTAMALRERELLDWRGYDGKTIGGWFITKSGTRALARAQSQSGMERQS